MIAARRGRTDITNILLEGEHIDLDIQENVRHHVDFYGLQCFLYVYALFIVSILTSQTLTQGERVWSNC